MESEERYEDLQERLEKSKNENKIDKELYEMIKVILKQAKRFIEVENLSELQPDLFVNQSLETAEKLIIRAEGKSS